MQIWMNVTQTMEAVRRHVPTHQDHECVPAGPVTDWLVMAEHVKVSLTALHMFSR